MKKPDRRQAKSGSSLKEQTSLDFTLLPTFAGTNNPRYLRVIHALLSGPKSRKVLDEIAGCSNGPDLISEIRKLGLGKDGLPCTMVMAKDRDGFDTYRGVYSLSDSGRRAVMSCLSKHPVQPDVMSPIVPASLTRQRNRGRSLRPDEGL